MLLLTPIPTPMFARFPTVTPIAVTPPTVSVVVQTDPVNAQIFVFVPASIEDVILALSPLRLCTVLQVESHGPAHHCHANLEENSPMMSSVTGLLDSIPSEARFSPGAHVCLTGFRWGGSIGFHCGPHGGAHSGLLWTPLTWIQSCIHGPSQVSSISSFKNDILPLLYLKLQHCSKTVIGCVHHAGRLTTWREQLRHELVKRNSFQSLGLKGQFSTIFLWLWLAQAGQMNVKTSRESCFQKRRVNLVFVSNRPSTSKSSWILFKFSRWIWWDCPDTFDGFRCS